MYLHLEILQLGEVKFHTVMGLYLDPLVQESVDDVNTEAVIVLAMVAHLLQVFFLGNSMQN